MAARNDYKTKKANQVGGGVGESKRFGGNYTREDADALPDGLEWDNLHVAGMPITQLPEENQRRLAFQQTDEGAAWWERNRHRLENREEGGHPAGLDRGMQLPTGGYATDPAEKEIIEFRDRALQGGAIDPYDAIMKKHVPKGFKGLMMSKTRMAQEGTSRGLLDYEIFRGKDGETVERGNMVLAIVPERLEKAAAVEYQSQAADQMRSAVANLEEQQDRALAGSDNKARIRKAISRSEDFSGVQQEQPEMVAGSFGREFA